MHSTIIICIKPCVINVRINDFFIWFFQYFAISKTRTPLSFNSRITITMLSFQSSPIMSGRKRGLDTGSLTHSVQFNEKIPQLRFSVLECGLTPVERAKYTSSPSRDSWHVSIFLQSDISSKVFPIWSSVRK